MGSLARSFRRRRDAGASKRCDPTVALDKCPLHGRKHRRLLETSPKIVARGYTLDDVFANLRRIESEHKAGRS